MGPFPNQPPSEEDVCKLYRPISQHLQI